MPGRYEDDIECADQRCDHGCPPVSWGHANHHQPPERQAGICCGPPSDRVDADGGHPRTCSRGASGERQRKGGRAVARDFHGSAAAQPIRQEWRQRLQQRQQVLMRHRRRPHTTVEFLETAFLAFCPACFPTLAAGLHVHHCNHLHSIEQLFDEHNPPVTRGHAQQPAQDRCLSPTLSGVTAPQPELRIARGIRSMSQLAIGAVLSIGDQASSILAAASEDHPVRASHRELPPASDDAPAAASDSAPATASEGSGENSPDPRLRHLLIGVAFAAEDRAIALSQQALRTAAQLSPYASWMIDAPVIAPARKRALSAIDGLVERGRSEEELGRAEASLLFNGVIERAVTSTKVDDVVGDVVGRVLDPVLGEALPLVIGRLRDNPDELVPLVNAIVAEALDPILREALPKVLGNIEQQPEMMVPLVQALVGEALEPVLHEALPQVIEVLNEDPEAIRSLVRDQSTGIAADMAHTVRTRAAHADDNLDRAIRRVMRRKAQPTAALTAGSKGALPAGSQAGPEAAGSQAEPQVGPGDGSQAGSQSGSDGA